MIIPHLPLLISFFTSLALCILIVATKSWHGAFTLDNEIGIQKIHVYPTPRVGGVAIYLGLVSGYVYAPVGVTEILLPALVASLPVFIFGLVEDLNKNTSPRVRLIASFVSGLLFYNLTGISLNRVDVLGFDYLLNFIPISILFTCFAISGLTNALNILDGLNGLSAGIFLICLSALGFIAYQSGDSELAKAFFVIAGSTGGFLLINFPFGRIFMGDGGAYLIGFVLAWAAILTSYRNASVSPWACLLACGYPIIEVLFSMLRRIANKKSMKNPDDLHMHSLLKKRYLKSTILNGSIPTVFIWILCATGSLFGTIHAKYSSYLIVDFILFFLIYLFIYKKLTSKK